MANGHGPTTGLTGLPAVPLLTQMPEAQAGAFQAAMSAAAAGTGPSQPAPLGTAGMAVATAIRDLEQQARAALKPGMPGQHLQGERTSRLGEDAPDAGHDRMIDHLIGAAQSNLRLIVWSQVIGNSVAKPAEVFSKLTQG